MGKQRIRQIIDERLGEEGLLESGIRGVQLFRVTEPVRCAPAVYEPSVIAIVGGAKEAIWDGTSHVYDSSRYLVCSMSMPVVVVVAAKHQRLRQINPQNPQEQMQDVLEVSSHQFSFKSMLT